MNDPLVGRIDARFGEAEASATTWAEAARTLTDAELYWFTSVRSDGRPHVTPLVGVFHDGAVHIVTGPGEQKARNLAGNDHVAVTTGTNTWSRGTDLVVEGRARRVTDHESLEADAAAYTAKYGEAWAYQVLGAGFDDGTGFPADVFRVDPDKVIAFAKDPHGQTTFRPC